MKEGDKVNLIIGNKTPLGYNVLINEEFEGLLYENEIFQTLEDGQKVVGYIKKIREDDKIDVSLSPQGFKNSIDIYTEQIIDELKKNNGFLELTDKSSPERIKSVLKMSKKSFKSAIGVLYKEQKIVLSDIGISLKE